MNKFWIVLAHTYMSRFKTKSFMVTTIIALVAIIALANFQSIAGLFNDDEQQKIAVLDETDQIYEQISENLVNTAEDAELVRFKGTAEEAKNDVQDEDYKAFLHITMNEQNLPEAKYYTKQASTSGLGSSIQQQLQQIKVAMATDNAGIDEATVQQIYSPVAFEAVSLKVAEGSGKTEEELNSARGLVYIMLFILYFAVITYGNMIAMDVANEKSSRVMEILISSASPVKQMFAKIAGIALLGLTQVGLFVVVGYVMITQKKDELVGGVFDYLGLKDVSISTFVYAIVFFVLGYLVYATLSAMLGSLVSRIEDVQQLMMPVIFLIMIVFFIAMFGLSTPNSTLVTVTSFIPFSAPMLMFLRVGMLDIPFWEVGLSIAIMLLTIALLAVIGARVYRGGVLMYGTGTSLKDLKKALRISKKER